MVLILKNTLENTKCSLKKIQVITRGMKRVINTQVMNKFIPNNIAQSQILPLHPTLYVKQNYSHVKENSSKIITIPETDYTDITPKIIKSTTPINTQINNILEDTLFKYKHQFSPKILQLLDTLPVHQQLILVKTLLKKNWILGGFADEKLQFYYPNIVKYLVAINLRLKSNEKVEFISQLTQHGFDENGNLYGILHAILLEVKNCSSCQNPYHFCFPCLYKKEGNIHAIGSLNHGKQPELTINNITRAKPEIIQPKDLQNKDDWQYASFFSEKVVLEESEVLDLYFPYYSNDLLNSDYLYTMVPQNPENSVQLTVKKAEDIVKEIEDEINA